MRFFGTGDPLLPIGQTVGKLLAKFHRTNSLMSILTELILEAWGGFGSLGGFGRLWETLGEPLGRLCGGLGRLGKLLEYQN